MADTTTTLMRKARRRTKRVRDAEMTDLGTYQTDIGLTRLLDREEEVSLANTCRDGADAAQRLETGAALTDAERSELEDAVNAGNEAAAQMAEANLRLVFSVAMKYRRANSGMEFADIIQAGNLGLLRAVEKFDPDRGCKFSTYAVPWIHHEIRRAFANESRLVRLPAYLNTASAKIARAEASAGDLSTEEAMEETGLTADTVEAIRAANKPVSLDAPPAGQQDASPLSAAIRDPKSGEGFDAAEERIWAEDAARLIDKAMEECLTQPERIVLRMRYGDDPQTLRAVGRALGVTPERVRTMENQAKSKMRSSRLASKLLAFVA